MARIVVSTDADHRREAVHGPAPRDVLAVELGELGDRAEPQRHEHAQTDAERGEHHERDQHPYPDRQAQEPVRERREGELVEERQRHDGPEQRLYDVRPVLAAVR